MHRFLQNRGALEASAPVLKLLDPTLAEARSAVSPGLGAPDLGGYVSLKAYVRATVAGFEVRLNGKSGVYRSGYATSSPAGALVLAGDARTAELPLLLPAGDDGSYGAVLACSGASCVRHTEAGSCGAPPKTIGLAAGGSGGLPAGSRYIVYGLRY